MTNISLNSVYEKSAGLVEAEMDGKVILLSVEEGAYLELAGVAREIWSAIDGIGSVGAIVAGLVEQYDVEEASCVAETCSFLDQASQKRLIALVE